MILESTLEGLNTRDVLAEDVLSVGDFGSKGVEFLRCGVVRGRWRVVGMDERGDDRSLEENERRFSEQVFETNGRKRNEVHVSSAESIVNLVHGVLKTVELSRSFSTLLEFELVRKEKTETRSVHASGER